MTGIHYEKCVVRRFRRCANVCLHKPRYFILLHTQAIWYSLLLLGYKPVQHVTGVLISPYPDQKGNKLQRSNSNFCKPLKKNSDSYPSNRVSATSMTSASDEQWRPFNCFFQSGLFKDLSALLHCSEYCRQLQHNVKSYNKGPPSYMRFVVDRNVVMRRIPVFTYFTFTTLQTCNT